MPGVLSSHMVLQRGMPIHVWGWSAPGERVTVALGTNTRETTGDTLGKWSLYLAPEAAGGPYQLTVTGNNRVVLEDVLVGDVWLASGQSNMEMPLKGFPGAPVKDSAAAYFFGRELEMREHVPIGLIDSTWGGTVAEAWMSLEGIAGDASLMPLFATRAQMMLSQADMAAILAKEKREDAEAKRRGQPAPRHPWRPDPASWAPAGLYNGMVAPLAGYTIKGVIWYQGESNSRLAFAPMYARIFPALIADWRARWGQGNFPFLYVQISNFKSDANEVWAVVREAQRRTLAVANTGMAVTADIGDPDNVHPADKQTVGARLALAARAVAYGEAVAYSGPIFRQATPEGSTIRVWFDHADGLAAKGEALQSFEVAADDRRFTPATAQVEGNTVVVSSPDVPAPKQVRYGWANSPVINLYNSAGLPASPFTSESAIPPR